MGKRRTLPLLQLGAAVVHQPAGAPQRGTADTANLPPLTDASGRAYRYVRISVTDRCNMACQYCMPADGEGGHALRRDVLSFEQIARLARVFAAMGVRRMRLTGGEPLLRKGLPHLIAMLRAETQLDDIWLTTNGVRLPQLAEELASAGLNGVNVSLDSLDADRFAHITRGANVHEVVSGIHAAQAAGLQVKLNAVALRGLNEDEIPSLTEWCWDRNITPRFIELMPLGEGAHLLPKHHLATSEIRKRLQPLVVDAPGERDPGAGPAHYLRARHHAGHKVGLIGAISDTFCSECNRIRLTSRGEIIACIASRTSVPLKTLIEDGASDVELAHAIHVALLGKAAGHSFALDSDRKHGRGMSLVGG